MTTPQLAGKTVLVVEDEYFQAMEAKEWLEDAGARVVGPSGDPQQIATFLTGLRVDAAVVDVNLGHGADFTVPLDLRRRGIPFLLVTGYDCDVLPEELAAMRCMSKPATKARLIEAVGGILEASEPATAR